MIMKKLFTWLASSIEDKRGAVSSKRLGFFWCLFMLNRTVGMPDVKEIVVWAIVGLAFGLVGLTIPEWFSNLKKDNI